MMRREIKIKYCLLGVSVFFYINIVFCQKSNIYLFRASTTQFEQHINTIITAIKQSNVDTKIKVSVLFNYQLMDKLNVFKNTYPRYLIDNCPENMINVYYKNTNDILEKFYTQNIKNVFQAYLIPDLLSIIVRLSNAKYQTFLRDTTKTLNFEFQKILYDVFSKTTRSIRKQEEQILKGYITQNNFQVIRLMHKYNYLLWDDSIVNIAIKLYPQQALSFLSRANHNEIRIINKSKNLKLKTLFNLSRDKYGFELLPFYVEFANNSLTIAATKETLRNKEEYYKLLINTRIKHVKQINEQNDTPWNSNLLYIRLSEFADQYFITPMNNMHELSDEVRFANIKNFNQEELYYLIVVGSDVLYTSSFIFIYNKLRTLLSRTKNYLTLFDSVKYDKYRKFIKTLATYNFLQGEGKQYFLSHFTAIERGKIIQKFTQDINLNDNDFLDESVDLISSFTGLKDKTMIALVSNNINDKLNEFSVNKNKKGQLIFSIYKQILDYYFNHSNDSIDLDIKQIFNRLKTLTFKELDKKKPIYEQAFFYDDEDANNSFNYFLHTFSNKNWAVKHYKDWVLIESTKGAKIKIYANRPASIPSTTMSNSQVPLKQYLDNKKIHPIISIHRGHSYFLPYTINQLNALSRLIILGSCGSNNQLSTILQISPNAQLISTRQIGTSVVNSTLFYVINENLRNNKVLVWTDIWAQINKKFIKSKKHKDFFNEYISPSDNLATLFFRLYYKRLSELK